MGRTTFVVVLFIMAAACVVIAMTSRSWGWLVGAILFSVVGIMARRRLKAEQETGREPPRLGFVGMAILGMLLAMGFLFWLQTSA